MNLKIDKKNHLWTSVHYFLVYGLLLLLGILLEGSESFNDNTFYHYSRQLKEMCRSFGNSLGFKFLRDDNCKHNSIGLSLSWNSADLSSSWNSADYIIFEL